MITHRAKLRRLAFISCPWSAAYADTRERSVPANRGGFTSPVTGNVGSGTRPAKGTGRAAAFITLFRKSLLAVFQHGCGAAARRGPTGRKPPSWSAFDHDPVAVERDERASKRPAQPRSGLAHRF